MNRDGKEKLSRRTAAKIYMLALIVIVGVSMILSSLEDRFGWQADFSYGQKYSLTEQTKQCLASLEENVQIFTLYSRGNGNAAILEILKLYAEETPHIGVANIDPSGARVGLEWYEEYENLFSDCILVYQKESGRYRLIGANELSIIVGEQAYTAAEAKITSAIHYVDTGRSSRILITSGHREAQDEDISEFLDLYRIKNYEVVEFDFLKSDFAPNAQTDVMISVSPRQDISEEEAQEIHNFIINGGTFVLLLDRAEYDGEQGRVVEVDTSMPILETMMAKYGMRMGNDLLYGVDSASTGLRSTILTIEGDVVGKELVMSECAPFFHLHDNASPILTARAFMKGNGAAKEYALGMASDVGGGRFLAFSTSSFLNNAEIYSGDNLELIDRIITTAVGEPDIQIDLKPMKVGPMVIGSGILKVTVTLVVLLAIPGGLLFVGSRVYKKRHKMD